MHPQALPDGAPGGVSAQRRADARTRVSAGRYRSRPSVRARPASPGHRRDPSALQLFMLDPVRTVGGAVLVTAAVAAFDLALTRRLSLFFDLCFILVSLSAAMLVRRRGLFAVGVLPPLLLGGVVAVLALLVPSALTASHLAFVSTWLTGLAHHGGALAAAHVVALALVGLRAAQQPARPHAQQPQTPQPAQPQTPQPAPPETQPAQPQTQHPAQPQTQRPAQPQTERPTRPAPPAQEPLA